MSPQAKADEWSVAQLVQTKHYLNWTHGVVEN